MKTRAKIRRKKRAKRPYPMPNGIGSVESKMRILHALDWIYKNKRNRKGGIKDTEDILWKAYKK